MPSSILMEGHPGCLLTGISEVGIGRCTYTLRRSARHLGGGTISTDSLPRPRILLTFFLLFTTPSIFFSRFSDGFSYISLCRQLCSRQSSIKDIWVDYMTPEIIRGLGCSTIIIQILSRNNLRQLQRQGHPGSSRWVSVVRNV